MDYRRHSHDASSCYTAHQRGEVCDCFARTAFADLINIGVGSVAIMSSLVNVFEASRFGRIGPSPPQ